MTDRPGTTGTGRIKVLYLIKVLAPGGAEQLLLTHLRLLDRARFEAHVAHIFDRGGDFPEQVRSSCDATIRLSRRNSPRSYGVVRLARLLLGTRYDVVHIHSPVLGSMARLIVRLRPRRWRPRIVTTEHLVWHGYHPATRWLNRWTTRDDDRIYAVSVAVRDSIVVPRPDRVRLLVHGVDLDRFATTDESRSRMRSELGVSDQTLLIGCVANFREQKNHALLVEILAELSRRTVDYRCAMVGAGPLEEATRRLVAARGLEGAVSILGVRDDVPALLGAMDVVVLTSLWEGLPVAVMEALAAGRPIVATDVDGIHEVLHDSPAAFLFPPELGAIPVVCDELATLAADPGERVRMGRAARDLSARFDAANATRELSACYEELVRSAPSPRRPTQR